MLVYEKWIAAGHHGEMHYLETERAIARRSDPRLIFPDCRSILVLATPYSKPIAHPLGPNSGRVAAYAWGSDYHDVLIERMQKLAMTICEIAGRDVKCIPYTDTGAILERDLAQRAGLGWIGRNTCLINPKHGSYLLLSEMLLDLDIEPDQPFTQDHCGTCGRCIESCPTGCILPDRTIDATRCISYLTIEKRGEIEAPADAQNKEWVFGCDICQQACPWNRFADAEGDPAFRATIAGRELDLPELLQTGDAEFRSRFQGSPVLRAKHEGMLRNALIVLGNRGDSSAAAVLSKTQDKLPGPLQARAAASIEKMNARAGGI